MYRLFNCKDIWMARHKSMDVEQARKMFPTVIDSAPIIHVLEDHPEFATLAGIRVINGMP